MKWQRGGCYRLGHILQRQAIAIANGHGIYLPVVARAR
jgi:hypothetical protein